MDPKRRRSGGKKRAAGDDLFGGGFAAPAEGDLGAAEALIVFELDVVFLAGDEIDGAGEFGGGVRPPATEDELAVDPEAHAIIGFGVEGVAFGFGGFDFAGPARGESSGGDEGRWRFVVPVEVDGGVGAGDGLAGEVHVVEISSLQAVGGGGAAAGGTAAAGGAATAR